MPDLPNRQSLGKLGEDLACEELQRRGYAILARRYRSRFGEIDIIGRDRGTLVFIEVKARRTTKRGTAAEAITPWKRRRIAAMALDYLAWTDRLNSPCRFDVVAIDHFGTDDMTVTLYQDAFHVDGR